MKQNSHFELLKKLYLFLFAKIFTVLSGLPTTTIGKSR